MRVRVGTLRSLIKEACLVEAAHREVSFDPESGKIVDRNVGPIPGTEGAQDWSRKRLSKWFRDHSVEQVTVPDARGKEKQMSVRRFLSQGMKAPVFKGEPEVPFIKGRPETPPPGRKG